MRSPSLYLDTNAWVRRDAFEFFRDFDKPYFNVCVRLDVAALKAAVDAVGPGLLWRAYHFLALRLSNQFEPFRLRLDGGRVRIHERVDGSSTVLREDGSFTFADLDLHAKGEKGDVDSLDFDAFAARSGASVAAARTRLPPFEPRPQDQARIHFTTLPWLHFTSFSHARNWGREDSIPKFAFGRIEKDGARAWLPMSVEVHHALMDGLHVGQFVQGFEAALRDPVAWLVQRQPGS
ncbi:MAG: CatA-like O-acetyltransferase [Burkholderiaceae bacterium]